MSGRAALVALGELSLINPPTNLQGLGPEDLVSFIPMSDVTDHGEWAVRRNRPLSEVRAGYTAFQEGDVLFAKITPCMENGKGCHAVGLTRQVGFGSTEFHVLRASEKAEARFLYHWSQSSELRLRAEAFMSGSAGQQRVAPGFFNSLLVLGLPLPEQRRIAEILDAADEAVRRSEALLAKLEQVKAGLLHDLLTRGLDEAGRLRDPEAHPEDFQDSILGRIPREWDLRSLQSCCGPLITYGIVQAGPHVENGVPYIRTGDMSGDSLQVEGLLRTSRSIARSYARSEVKAGEIVCAIRATLGKVLEVPPELDGANLTQGTARIAPHPEVCGHYLLWCLRTKPLQSQFEMAQKGTTFAEITLTDLRLLLVPLPPLPEQRRIAAILDAHRRPDPRRAGPTRQAPPDQEGPDARPPHREGARPGSPRRPPPP